MRTSKNFLFLLTLAAAPAAGAAEPIRPLAVPPGLPAASVLPESARRAVAESFEALRRQLAPGAGNPALPARPLVPPLVPQPMPKFDAETQARIEESFARFLMTSTSMASLASGALAPTSPAVAEAPLRAEVAAPSVAAAEAAPIPRLLPSYAHLAEDPVDPLSAVGVALSAARAGSPPAAEEETIFARVHFRYAERELALSNRARTR